MVFGRIITWKMHFFRSWMATQSVRPAAAHRAAACGAVRSERYAAYRAVQRRGTAARPAPDGGAGSVLERQHAEYTAPVHKYTVCLHRRGDIDGTVYTVEMIRHRGGALLAYLWRDRAAYDGSLRSAQTKSSRYLGALMAEAEQVKDPALADGLRRQCMRLYWLTHRIYCMTRF